MPTGHKSVGQDPWHMWGTTVSLVRQDPQAALVPVQQMVNIDAKYPISWRFFLSAEFSWLAPNPGVMGAQVRFYLQHGVGRSNVRLAPWHVFTFTDAELTASNGQTITKWCSAVTPPDPGFPPPTGVAGIPQDVVVAQSIQVQADLLITGITGLNTVQTAIASAFFAPQSHVRPEWFAGHFGSELGGN